MGDKKPSLLVYVSQANAIAEALIESEGELNPEIESALTVNEKGLAERIDAYAVIMDRLEWEAEFLKAKGKEILAKSKALEIARERLRSNVKIAMDVLNTKELSGTDYKFKLTRARPKLNLDQKQLPSEFLTEIISYEPDKDAITDALLAGMSVPGASLEESMALRKFVKGDK